MLMRMIKYAKVRGLPKYITKPNKFDFDEIYVLYDIGNSKVSLNCFFFTIFNHFLIFD